MVLVTDMGMDGIAADIEIVMVTDMGMDGIMVVDTEQEKDIQILYCNYT